METIKTQSLTINLFAALFISAQCFAQIPILESYDSPLPKVVTPRLMYLDAGVAAPSDAISLFNGKDLSEWTSNKWYPEWTVQDGMVIVKEGTCDILTKRDFGDFQLY
jgi:hypothetical protein